jgi:hypothetical protein
MGQTHARAVAGFFNGAGAKKPDATVGLFVIAGLD